jgi:hypothetical protein
LGFLKKVSDEWLKALLGVSKQIQTIGEKRNHYVHDLYWNMQHPTEPAKLYIVREESKTKLRTIADVRSVGAEEVEVTPQEIWDVVDAIKAVDDQLDALFCAFWEANPDPSDR